MCFHAALKCRAMPVSSEQGFIRASRALVERGKNEIMHPRAKKKGDAFCDNFFHVISFLYLYHEDNIILKIDYIQLVAITC